MCWSFRTAYNPLTSITVKQLLRQGYLTDDFHTSVIVHNFDLLQKRIAYLTDTFPDQTLHALAVKANPLPPILQLAVDHGMGLETASSGEIALAQSVGCPAEKIVFDSPAKTRAEIEQASHLGITVNVNSSSELERVAGVGFNSPVGLRVNPVVAEASRESTTMVATARSKFGVPISRCQELLQQYPQLTGLHVHVGSQVATKDDLVEASRRVVELADQFPNIQWLDIGGGLPTQYSPDDPGLDPKDYFEALKEAAPTITNYRLITEMGRALQSNCGFAVSKVEYVTDDRLIVHLGADFALRECYQPDSWYHDIEIFDSNGNPKTGSKKRYDIFGPLCFSGDRLAKEREFPEVEEGDLLVIHDCGGYTLGMWSRYCSRLMPEIVGVTKENLTILKPRETEEKLLQFWA